MIIDQATTQNAASLAVTTPLGTDVLILEELTGTEYVSELFHFTLVMRSARAAFDLDLTKLVDQPMTVTLVGDEGGKRIISGLCTRVVQTATCYVAELRPWLWKLGQAADHRIFQNTSALEIIKTVFSDLGYSDVKDSTTASYAKREYCVQYRETSLNFVLRLMEDEGIFYYFSHAEGKHTLVLADDLSAYQNITTTPTVPYRVLSPGTQWIPGNHIDSCSVERGVASGSYQSDDYNFTTPTTELKASATGTVKGHAIYEYPGNYQAKDQGDARAKLRVAELQAPVSRLLGTGVVRGFTAGYKFTLKEHPRADINTAWILHSVSHRATPREYTNSFVALPASTAFRPPRRTPAPRIAGNQTAAVVGKSGQEIYTDQYGRIKVQFHWDQVGKKDENSSCWVRVAQGWAGKNWGAFFLPRVGMEVLVSFLEGNPDQPIVIGCVYNGANPVPYALDANQTRSTLKSNSSKGGKGYNEIRFEDKADSEELYVQAQKDMTVLVKNKRSVTIEKSDDSLTLNEGNRSISVTKGTETHNVKGTRDLTIEDAETHTNNDGFTQNVSKGYTLKVDGDIEIEAGGAIIITAGKGITMKSSQAMNLTSGAGLTAKAATDAVVQGMNATVKASVGATVQGGATLNLKGAAQATLDGGGMTAVKGGLITLN